MLLQFQHVKTQGNNNTDHHLIFEQAKLGNSTQIYSKNPTNVNAAIQTHQALTPYSDKTLTASQIWEGLKLKGKSPQIFTYPIVVAAVIEGSRQQTNYGEKYDRVSLQPSWVTGNIVVVKEETYADDNERKMVFLGRDVDIVEAKAHLIPAILEDINSGSEKAINLIPQDIPKEQIGSYLNDNFENLFCQERPALFHVQHGIIGEEDMPFETWDLVRLAQNNPDQVEIYEELRKMIGSSISVKLYAETINHLEQKNKYTL